MTAPGNFTCPCGQSSIALQARPLARFICHCLICQKVYKAPHADVVALWAGGVVMPHGQQLTYRTHRLPPALQRGTCRSCDAPVVGFLRVAPGLRMAFVAARNAQDAAWLPPVQAHIFYHRRTQDAVDSLPKVEGYWPSELMVGRMLLQGSLKPAR